MDQETISVQIISYLTIFANPSFNLLPPWRIGAKCRNLLAANPSALDLPPACRRHETIP
jgi:hypothetical protein